MDKRTIQRAYAWWAPIYPVVFGWLLKPGRRRAVRVAEERGGRIIEVGAGRGCALPLYSARWSVTCIDISGPMVMRARKLVQKRRLDHVAMPRVMDAAEMEFDDEYFDVVVAQYLLPAVSDPEAVLDEMLRVLKAGGEIILLNHFRAEEGMRRFFEELIAPLACRLGWDTTLSYSRVWKWASKHDGVEIHSCESLGPLGLFSLVRIKKHRRSAAAD